MDNKHDNHGNGHKHSHHYILPVGKALAVGGTLLFLTAVTVWVAHIDLGKLNFVIAMVVATCKGLLVATIFMNLRNDRRENAVIFATSFLFLTIFITLTSTDIFFRGDVYVKGPLIAEGSQPKSKLKKPWVATPELVAHGKELFAVNCVSCHGVSGHGDGPAASALNPHPRNFTSTEGWKNGRKPTMVFKTLKEGLPNSPMASFATLPSDDRWALAHFVLSLGGPAQADAAGDFAKIGVDPNKADGGGGAEEASIPVEFAMQRITEPTAKATFHGGSKPAAGPGTRVYEAHCASCHGEQGQGGIKVRNLGVNPVAYLTTDPFSAASEILKTQEKFDQLVAKGVPGDVMPGFGQLSALELRDLYQYVRTLEASR